MKIKDYIFIFVLFFLVSSSYFLIYFKKDSCNSNLLCNIYSLEYIKPKLIKSYDFKSLNSDITINMQDYLNIDKPYIILISNKGAKVIETHCNHKICKKTNFISKQTDDEIICLVYKIQIKIEKK